MLRDMWELVKSQRRTRGTFMSVLSNESCSHYMCVEATLPFSAVAQRRLNGKVTKVHERNFYESLFE